MVERSSASEASRAGHRWLRHLRQRPTLALLGAWIIFLAVVGHQQIAIREEILDPAPYFNDNVLHLALARSAAAALERGEDPTDFWFAPVTQGYPLFHHYQHLPHVTLALVHRLTGGALSIGGLFRWSTLLLLALFPFSVAWTVWRLGLGRTAGLFAGTAAALLSAKGLYGLDLTSFGWAGYGMTTQLWGAVLLGPVWALTRRAVLEGRGVVLAALLNAVLLLTHTVLGYVAVLSSVLFLVAPRLGELVPRIARLAVLLGLAAAIGSYFIVPFWLDRDAMNRSRWEKPEKYDAYGAERTLSRLVRGELLDDDPVYTRGESGWPFERIPRRLPVLTLLAAVGLAFSAWRSRRHPAWLVLPLLFVFWLLVYFGRPTWGGALRLLPLSENLHFHRLIAPVHLAAAGLAGVGLAAIWNGLCRLRHVGFFVLAVVLAAILLAGPVLERHDYYTMRRNWCSHSRAELVRDDGAIGRVLDRIKASPAGRVYPGRANNWGADYRVGYAQVYSLVMEKRLDNIGYLYHALSLNAEIEGYMDETRPAHFNLFNVRYVVAPEGRTFPAFVKPLGQEGRHRYYAVETSGYVDLVDVPVAFQGPKAGWYPVVEHWLKSRLVEAGQRPAFFLDRSAPEAFSSRTFPLDAASAGTARDVLHRLAGSRHEGDLGRVVEKAARPGRYVAAVDAKRSCYAVLKATYHPGWQVTVDGRPAETVMLAPAHVGVAVPPGAHEVAFEYVSGRLRSILFWAGLAVVVAGFVVEWRIGRKRAVPANSAAA